MGCSPVMQCFVFDGVGERDHAEELGFLRIRFLHYFFVMGWVYGPFREPVIFFVNRHLQKQCLKRISHTLGRTGDKAKRMRNGLKNRQKEKIIMNICTNSAFIEGTIASPYCLAYATEDGVCYRVFVKTMRLSGVEDTIPVIVPELCLKNTLDATGRTVVVSGTFCSRNNCTDGKRHLELYLYAEQFIFTDGQEGRVAENRYKNNQVILEGFICKEPVYRNTPLGREIADIVVAVNRRGVKYSDYIPCIAWGRNALLAAQMDTGDFIRIEGRIQSREYRKRLQGPDGQEELLPKVAYEVSCKNLKNT